MCGRHVQQGKPLIIYRHKQGGRKASGVDKFILAGRIEPRAWRYRRRQAASPVRSYPFAHPVRPSFL
jgi:hypothetical protein